MLKRTVDGYLYEEFIYCGCGCGKTRSRVNSSGNIRTHLAGHGIKGKTRSEETRKKMSLSQIGEKNHNFGKKASEETRKKMSQKQKGRILTEETKLKIGIANSGVNSHWWKGDNIGYQGLHIRVRTKFPKPNLCMLCKQVPPEELACITSIYNSELRNWAWLCVKCHRKWDNLDVRVAIKIREKSKLQSRLI